MVYNLFRTLNETSGKGEIWNHWDDIKPNFSLPSSSTSSKCYHGKISFETVSLICEILFSKGCILKAISKWTCAIWKITEIFLALEIFLDIFMYSFLPMLPAMACKHGVCMCVYTYVCARIWWNVKKQVHYRNVYLNVCLQMHAVCSFLSSLLLVVPSLRFSPCSANTLWEWLAGRMILHNRQLTNLDQEHWSTITEIVSGLFLFWHLKFWDYSRGYFCSLVSGSHCSYILLFSGRAIKE